MSNELIPPGTEVRVKSDPSREGVVTAGTQTLGPIIKQGVRFPDGLQFLMPSQLEVIEDHEQFNPIELFRKCQFAGADTLNQAFVFHRLNGSLAEVLYSMDATNTDFYAYQYKPLLNFLDSPTEGLLIADEVGLGKTIEAGIIWTELRARYDDSCLLVVCPAALCEKWKQELSARFSVKADICTAGELLSLLEQHVRGEVEDFAVICSIQGIRPPRREGADDVAGRPQARLSKFLQEYAHQRFLFDLVIVDEAHHMRNPESLARKLGTHLRNVTKNLILMSATPLQMRNQDLFSLLSLLDENTFIAADSFEEVLLANEPLIRLRDNVLRQDYEREQFIEDLNETRNVPIISNSRQLKSLKDNLPASEEFDLTATRSLIADALERVNLLSHVVTRTRRRDVKEWKVIRRATPKFIDMSALEHEIYESVTEEIKRFCASRPDLPEGFALSTPQRQIASSVPAAILNWRSRRVAMQPEYDEDLLDKEEQDVERFGPLVSKMVEIAERLPDVQLLEAEDTKFHSLAGLMKEVFSNQADEKLLLFSYFKPTLEYLNRRLEQLGYRCQVLHGDTPETKVDVIERFRTSDKLQVLLSSEVASEGVDLQFCRILVNYDLPWNPMRIEQRIGRLDRIGQKAEAISIFNFFYNDTIDSRIYQRLLTRLGIFERALGSTEAIIGEQISKLTNELIRKDLTQMEQDVRFAQTEQAIANIQVQTERLENDASSMIAHADTILREVHAARTLHRYVRKQDLFDFVSGAIKKHFPKSNLVLLDENKLECDIQLCPEANYEFTGFLASRKSKIRTALLGTRPGRWIFRFETKVEGNRSGVEVITNFHPLIRFLSSKLTACGIPVYPPIAVRIKLGDDVKLQLGEYVFQVRKLIFEGIKKQEWLKYACINIESGVEVIGDEAEKLIGVSATEGQRWNVPCDEYDLKQAEHHLARCDELLDADIEYHVHRLESENQDRIDLQERNVKKKFNREIARENEILERLIVQGKMKVVPARRGIITSLEKTRDQRLFDLSQSRRTRHDGTRVVATGLIEAI